MTVRRISWKAAMLLLCLFAILPLTAFAEDAREISGMGCVRDASGFQHLNDMFDGNRIRGYAYQTGAWVTFENEGGIGSLYMIFDREPSGYTVVNNDTGESGEWGTNNFLHEFIDVEGYFGSAPKSVTVRITNGPVYLNEISVFTPGQVPSWVQRWDKPFEDGTDLVLFSTHADDEQLFFSGVLPYYAGELNYRVQVVYLTNHRNLPKDPFRRCHEALDGLWSVGVRAYPHFGHFGDYFTRNLKDCYSIFHMQGVTDEELLSYVVEQIRRFKPLVAVGHDINGEYAHGQHMVYTDLLMQALEITNDPSQFPESAEKYGTWDVPKTYLHLYEENPIVMDWDQPLSKFNGLTAFQVSKTLGWPCHVSQQLDFAWYTMGKERAVDVEKYAPCYYGLYRSTVGEDAAKNDFFENLLTRDEQLRLEEEAARKAEEEARLAAEEAARKEAEEAARIAQEQAAVQAERQARDAKQLKNNALIKAFLGEDRILYIMAFGSILVVTLALIAIILIRKKNN